MDRQRHIARLGWALGLFALVTYVSTAGGSLTTSDAVVTFEVTRNIVDHGTVAVPEAVLGWEAQRGRDGRFYSPFGIGQSLLHVPVYVVTKAAIAVTGLAIGKPDTVPKAVIAMTQSVVVATLVWLTFHVGVVVARSPRAAALGAMTLAFGSAFWPYAGFGFNQPLAALLLLAAVYDTVVGTTRHQPLRLWRAGLWVGLALHVRHEMALVAVPLTLWLLWRGAPWPVARGQVLRFVPGVAAGVLGWMAFNGWRYGNPLDPGYLNDETVGFFSSMGDGMAGLLVSPGASVFVYSPVAVVGLWGLIRWSRTPDRSPDRSIDRSVAVLCLAVIATFLLFYASIGSWSGGRSYGSRYLLPVLPLFVVGWSWWLARLAPVVRRRAFLAVFLVGAVVQIPGVLLDYSKVSQATRRYSSAEREWTLEASPLVLNTRALAVALPRNLTYVLGLDAPPPVTAPLENDDRGFAQQFGFSLDLWWLYLFYFRAYSTAGLMIVVLALATAWAAVARWTGRAYRQVDAAPVA